MELHTLTFQGPPIDDIATLDTLPSDLRGLLEQVNGFIQFGGGLHIRGACLNPDWHSLAEFWTGSVALWKLYPALKSDDVPFGQDAVGDQFVLRDDVVHRLSGETGELDSFDCDVFTFLQSAQDEPVEFLGLNPLLQFHSEGGQLQPGQLLSVYPPFCIAQAGQVSLRAISAVGRIQFLTDFAAQLSDFPDGTPIKIIPTGTSAKITPADETTSL